MRATLDGSVELLDRALGYTRVQLGDGESREGAGKARRRARSERQFGGVGEGVGGAAMIGERQDQAVLGFDHFVRDLFAKADAEVRGQSPWRCGPDHGESRGAQMR